MYGTQSQNRPACFRRPAQFNRYTRSKAKPAGCGVDKTVASKQANESPFSPRKTARLSTSSRHETRRTTVESGTRAAHRSASAGSATTRHRRRRSGRFQNRTPPSIFDNHLFRSPNRLPRSQTDRASHCFVSRASAFAKCGRLDTPRTQPGTTAY